MPIQRTPSISPLDMRVVEQVLNMRTGYVLDFSNFDFDNFIFHTVGVDASEPKWAEDGVSKAKRLRRILSSLTPDLQAKLLRALLQHRDSIENDDRFPPLDLKPRQRYERIVEGLVEHSPPSAKPIPSPVEPIPASSWTGRRTIREQAIVVRNLVPLAVAEINLLADLVEAKRFNDPVTADAVKCLRELHTQLGELLAAVDNGGSLMKSAVAAIEKNRLKLIGYLQEGAKVAIVAPVLSLGVVHILSALSGVPIDSTMVSTVFGSVVGLEALKSVGKITSLAAG
jgi:hypothetical protein